MIVLKHTGKGHPLRFYWCCKKSATRLLERYSLVHLTSDADVDIVILQMPSETTYTYTSFIGETVSNHDELMSNFFAQPDALAYGKVHTGWLDIFWTCFIKFLALLTETDFLFRLLNNCIVKKFQNILSLIR